MQPDHDGAHPTVSPYAGTTPIASLRSPGSNITLVEGQTFCVSDVGGEIRPELPTGLFLLDTRLLSRLELRLDGHQPEALTAVVTEPYTATFVARGRPASGRSDPELTVVRTRHIGRGMRETIALTNHGMESIDSVVELSCDVDFADVFAVKEGRVREQAVEPRWAGPTARYDRVDSRGAKRVTIAFSEPPSFTSDGSAVWRLSLDAAASWELCAQVTVTIDGAPIEPTFRCGARDHEAAPVAMLAAWRASLPDVETDDGALERTVRRSGEDLGALRIFDPDHPDTPILAAGAPWFMTVFGRDSLLTAWMGLIADPSLAEGVLDTLARFQGTDVDPRTEEEPGKILHEMRFAGAGGLALGGGDVYYGSIDSTPLFVMLLGELRRWDLDDEAVERLLPHADRALEWIERFGDRDGDGYVEYERQSEHGLVNQGWKDSWDAIRFGDGRLAEPPIALCEVQGYVYAAYTARAHFAREADDETAFDRWTTKATELRTRFNEDFWLDEHGCFALGLDRDKRPIDALASNMGHLLWTGIVDPDRATVVADRLVSPDLFSGWGIRTLSASMRAYNPISYHNGSVWPHDNAICAAGLVRYGFVEQAHRVIQAQLDVADATSGRLPELFAGFERQDVPAPAPYPASCSPQAWAAAAPLLWLRALLRLDPWTPHGRVWIHPELPESMHLLRVAGIVLGDRRLTVTVEQGDVTVDVTGPPGLEIVHAPRVPVTVHV